MQNEKISRAERLRDAKVTHRELWNHISSKHYDNLSMSTDSQISHEAKVKSNMEAEDEFLRAVEFGSMGEFIPAPVVESVPVVIVPAVKIEEPKDVEGKVTAWRSNKELELRELAEKSKGITIAGHVEGEKKGFEVVHEKRMSLKNARVGIENRRVELKENITKAGKLVDSTARDLTAIISPEELRLEADEKAYTDKIAKEKAAIEEAKKAKTNARLEQIRLLGAQLSLDKAQNASDDEWALHIEQCTADKVARDAVEKEKREAEEKRIKDEQDKLEAQRKEQQAERDRLEADRKAFIQAEEAKQAKLGARLKELRDLGAPIDIEEAVRASDVEWYVIIAKYSDEKKVRDAAAAEEQRQIEETRKAQQEEQKRLDDEKKKLEAEQKRIADEAAEEQRKKDQEAKDAQEAAEKQARDDAEKARIEALRPDMEKALQWAKDVVSAIESVKIPEVESDHVKELMTATVSGIKDALTPFGV